jgi:hypothetical protein
MVFPTCTFLNAKNAICPHTAEGTVPSETEPMVEIGSWYLDEFGNPTREIKRRD